MGTCKLCLKNKPLVESHIIPEFMYKPLYDANHRFNLLAHSGRGVIGTLPKGIYERLLCGECDNAIIGRYESYAARVLFNKRGLNLTHENTNFGLVVHGIDYKLFKLFQISLLWRCAIASDHRIHKIDLGHHLEVMRTMLLSENPCEYFRYGVQLYYFPVSSKSLIDLIVSPVFIERQVDGHKVFRAIFNGLCWFFVLSEPTRIYKERNYFLSENGELPIINAGYYGEKFIYLLAKDFMIKSK